MHVLVELRQPHKHLGVVWIFYGKLLAMIFMTQRESGMRLTVALSKNLLIFSLCDLAQSWSFSFVIFAFALLSECHGGSVALISAWIRRGSHGYFRSECCTARWRVNGSTARQPFPAPTHYAGHEAEYVISQVGPTVFEVFEWPTGDWDLCLVARW